MPDPEVNLAILISMMGTRNGARLLFIQYTTGGRTCLRKARREEKAGMIIMKRSSPGKMEQSPLEILLL